MCLLPPHARNGEENEGTATGDKVQEEAMCASRNWEAPYRSFRGEQTFGKMLGLWVFWEGM